MTGGCRPRLLVSACLLGLPTRFDGGGRERPAVVGLAAEFVLVPVCPEQLGGLPTPRAPAEIRGGAGEAVLAGTAPVVTIDGLDVSAQFVAGARAVVGVARIVGAVGAVLKARSPSCGVGETYDGSFRQQVRRGDGVTAAALRETGLRLWTEEMVDSGESPANRTSDAGGAAEATRARPVEGETLES